MTQTKVVYYVGDENTPYLVKVSLGLDEDGQYLLFIQVPVDQSEITLGDFKRYINIKQNYKYFFQSFDEDYGLVKEEITGDAAVLPKTQEGKIVCFLTPAEEPKVIIKAYPLYIVLGASFVTSPTGWNTIFS